MAGPRSLVTDGPRPEDLVTLPGAKIKAYAFNGPRIPYFTVEVNGELLDVRLSVPETQQMIIERLGQPIDLTIFPYKWEIFRLKHRSGVINFFHHFRDPQRNTQET